MQLIHLHRDLGEDALLCGVGIIEALGVALHNLHLFPHLRQLLINVHVGLSHQIPPENKIRGATSAPQVSILIASLIY